MREIKFRYIWNYADGTFITKVITLNDLQYAGIQEFDFLKPYPRGRKRSEFTGLQDKNGTDIYEGDYVVSKRSDGRIDNKGVIEKETETDWCWGSYGTISCALTMYKDVEIIGNIYTHPELVNKEDK